MARRSVLVLSLLLAATLRAGASPPDAPIATPAGPLVVTEHRTIARVQDDFGRRDFSILLERARAVAKARRPNRWRVLAAVVRELDVEWEDSEGAKHRTRASLSDQDVARIHGWFATTKELVLALTGGALELDEEWIEVRGPIRSFDPMGKGVYWLGPHTALAGRDVPKNRYDSVVVYYRPKDIPMGLLGGTFGADNGIAGAGVSSLQLPEGHWGEDLRPFPVPAVAMLHEWLHQMSWCARTRLGYVHTPDCHAAEENGWTITDGGYGEWVAWYRSLMLGLMTEEFWRGARMAGPVATGPVNAGVEPGSFFGWDDVREDWQRRLPVLDERFLRERTGLAELGLTMRQSRANDSTWLVVTGLDVTTVASPVASGAAPDTKLDNVLSLVRLPREPGLDEAAAAFGRQPIEALAVVRPRAGKRRDYVFVRADVAPVVLPLLATKGPRATERLLGFVSLPDPSERHPMVFLVAEVDLGATLPEDELAAVGLGG